LADLFAGLAGRHRTGRSPGPIPGADYEAGVHLTFDQAYAGTEIELDLIAVEYDDQGNAKRVPHRLKVRVPPGVVDGQKLRVPGKGGKGLRGGRDGDLYLDINVESHPLYRADGLDLHIDLPLAPWEAVLGTSVEMPTPAGTVSLKVPPGTRAGQKLRLTGRGLKRPDGTTGHFYAVVQIAVPTVVDERQRELYRQLAGASSFNPRAHFEQEFPR
jgi:curved DNA-binding protein